MEAMTTNVVSSALQNPSDEFAKLQNPSEELAKLVRKLRWIGLDDEARCIENAMCAIPADIRPSVLGWPPNTD